MDRLIRRYAGFQFFFGLLIWLPVYYEYQKRMGLTDASIFQIQSIYQIWFCFLEIPTGYFADRFGYRFSMRTGSLVLIVANLIPIFFVDYTSFLAHFLLIALSRSFISGASSAYIYEALREQGETARYRDVEGRARAYALIGKVVCWAAVGALMEWHVTLPYWLTATASATSLAFAWALPRLVMEETPRGGRDTHAEYMIFGAFAALSRSPLLILLMLQGVAIFFLSRLAQGLVFQPILDSKAIPLTMHGAVMSAMTVFEAVGSYKPQWARRWMKDIHLVTVLTMSLALTLGIVPWLGAWGTVASLCVFSLAVGWSFPVQKQVMNDAIPDSRFRATMLSIESIVDRGIAALATLLLARYMAEGRMDAFLIESGLATVIAAVVIGVAAWILPKGRATAPKGS